MDDSNHASIDIFFKNKIEELCELLIGYKNTYTKVGVSTVAL